MDLPSIVVVTVPLASSVFMIVLSSVEPPLELLPDWLSELELSEELEELSLESLPEL